ncbi:MAG: Uma2 family endonuclease [Actinomycetota bacterium]
MARQLTYEDYVRFPADRRWELIEGVPHVVPSPNLRHQEIAGLLYATILFHLREHGGGRVFIAPFDAVLTDIDVVQPDVVFLSDADAGVLTDDNIMGSPTWVIEVLSNPYYERDKLRRYEAASVSEHWLVNPYEDSLEVRLLAGSTYGSAEIFTPPALVRPTSLPSLQIDLGDILKR